MNKDQFINEIFILAFGETQLTQELIKDKDYETVINKIVEYSNDALKWQEMEDK